MTTMRENERRCDVVIVGGGPAGSSAAAVLAAHGRDVLIVEREKFPRYHIGESLIPFTFGPLERIGMIPKMRRSAFVRKYSVQFVQPSGRASQPFYFSSRYDPDTVAQTWQVLRSEFDVLMLENAREKGAEVWEGTEALNFLGGDGRCEGVRVRRADGFELDVRASVTIDATGRDAMAMARNGWRRGDPGLNKVAVWTYYKGAKRDPGRDEGATTIGFIPNKGWFWYIPQHNDMVSVGVVADGKYLSRDGVKDPKAIFRREIPENKWVEDHLSEGVCTGEYWLASEYTYRSQYGAADGLVLVGDAYGFLDPVFSSGVMLALKSGVLAGDAVHGAIGLGDTSAAAFKGYTDLMREGLENMRTLVYAFYDPAVSFKELAMKFPEAQGWLTDCLSGDVNKDYSGLREALSTYTALPEALPFGAPAPSGSGLVVKV
jgi:flavin-dependent dehydrogenase